MIGFSKIGPDLTTVWLDWNRWSICFVTQLEDVSKHTKKMQRVGSDRNVLLVLAGMPILKLIESDHVVSEAVRNMTLAVFDSADKLTAAGIPVCDTRLSGLSQKEALSNGFSRKEFGEIIDRAKKGLLKHQLEAESAAVQQPAAPDPVVQESKSEPSTSVVELEPAEPVAVAPEVVAVVKPAIEAAPEPEPMEALNVVVKVVPSTPKKNVKAKVKQADAKPSAVRETFQPLLEKIADTSSRKQAGHWIASRIQGRLEKDDWQKAATQIQAFGLPYLEIKSALANLKTSGLLEKIQNSTSDDDPELKQEFEWMQQFSG